MKQRVIRYLQGDMTSSLFACLFPILFWGITTLLIGVLLTITRALVLGNRLSWTTVAAIAGIGALIGAPKAISNIRHWHRQKQAKSEDVG